MLKHFISTFYWKNPAASYLIMLIPTSLAFSFAEPRKGWRIFYAIFCVLASSGLILTRSRGAWIACAATAVIGSFFIVDFLPRITRRLVLIGICAILMANMVMPPAWILKRVTQMSEIAKQKPDEPIEERWMMLDMGRRMLNDHPIVGIGMGAFKIAYPLYLKNTHYLSSHLHNQYLQLAAEGGILAAILFIMAIFATIASILWHARKKQDMALAGIGLGTLAYAIHIALEFSWEFWGTSLMFMTLIAVGAKMACQDRIRYIEGAKKAMVVMPAILCFLVAIALSVAGAFFDSFEATIDFSRREKLISICNKINPLSARYWYERANLYTSRKMSDKALWSLEKAQKLEPANVIVQYGIGFLLWDSDTEKAVEHLKRAVALSPNTLPELQLNFAQKAGDAGMTELEMNVLKKILAHFSTNPNARYTDKTAGHRYIVARAALALADIEYQKGNIRTSDSLCQFGRILGCPRYEDKLAKDWELDIISPEQTVAEMIDAANVGDTLRAWQFIADSTRIRVQRGTQLFLMQIYNVKQDMLTEKATVDILFIKIANGRIFSEMGFFDLVLSKDGWKIKF